jgi:lysophospholipase L1-like esterase
MNTSRIGGVVFWALGALLLAVISGFWFHSSGPGAPIFGKYSPRHFLLACALTACGGMAILVVRFLLTRQEFRSSSGRKRIVPLRAKLMLVFIPLAVMLAVAEIALGSLGSRHGDLTVKNAVFHPYLQAVPEPGNSTLHINRWGFRGDEIELVKPDRTYRVFVIGGSTVYCDRTQFEDSHARILEKRLQDAHPGVNIEVQNAGMHWHTSQHSLVKFLTKVQDFEPDLVILYHAVNDLCRSFSPPSFSRGPFENDYGNYDGPVANMVREYFGLETVSRFAVVEAVREGFRRYWFSDFRRDSDTLRRLHPSPGEFHEWNSLPSYRRNMKSLAEIITNRGIDLIMASQPYAYREGMSEKEWSRCWIPRTSCRSAHEFPDSGSMARGMQAFNRTSRQIADALDVPYVDLESMVPKNTDHFRDGVHYTKKGNRIIGEALTKVIVESKLVRDRLDGS